MARSEKNDKAEAELREAQGRLAQAQQEAAEAQQGLAATVTQNIPPITVVVNKGCVVGHEDKSYYGEGYALAPEGHTGSDEVELSGPSAIALVQAGIVTIKGSG